MVINYFQSSGKSWRLDKRDSLEVEIVVDPTSSGSEASKSNQDFGQKTTKTDINYFLRHPFLREKVDAVSLSDLTKYRARTKDYYIGKVEDVYVDDYHWHVKYVKLSGFKGLRDRYVFVPADKINLVRPFSNTLAIDFDLEDLAWYPNIFVSEGYEDFVDKLKANIKIQRAGATTNSGMSHELLSSLYLKSQENENLRKWASVYKARIAEREAASFNVLSCKDIKNYKVLAQNGSQIALRDVVVNVRSWEFSYLVFEIAHWFSTRRVACPTCFIQGIDDISKEISLAVPLAAIKTAPSFESKIFDKNYENILFNHYINFFDDEMVEVPQMADVSSGSLNNY